MNRIDATFIMIFLHWVENQEEQPNLSQVAQINASNFEQDLLI